MPQVTCAAANASLYFVGRARIVFGATKLDLYLVKRSAISDRVAIDAIRLAPKTIFSGLVGWGARKTLPKPLRAPLYGAFANLVGAQLGEVEHSLSDYRSFGAFFSRGLKEGARVFEEDPTHWTAPCDSMVANAGRLAEEDALVAKGRSFSLAALLASDTLAKRVESGEFATLYLSPRDYHRVHAPTDCKLIAYQYVPGKLYPVKPFFVEHIDNLFAVNERLVLEFECTHGVFSMVLVGAAGVGNIRWNNPPIEGRHLRAKGKYQAVRLSHAIEFKRGDELGAFELGSTVILCTGFKNLEFSISIGDSIQLGESIARPSRSDSQGDSR